MAFEPQPLVFQTLCANMALNCVTNVRCFQKAVGAEPGEILVPAFDCTRKKTTAGYRSKAVNGGNRPQWSPSTVST